MMISEKIIKFNDHLSNIAFQQAFAVLAIAILSISSFFTTYLGFKEYTDQTEIALTASFGIQLLLLYTAVQIAKIESYQSVRATWMFLLFLVAMTVSSFFSFAAFHSRVETDERRAEEGVTILRSQWGLLFNKIRGQIIVEFESRLNNASNTRPNGSYAKWREDVASLKAAAVSFSTQGNSRVREILDQSVVTRTASERALSQQIETREALAKELRQIQDRLVDVRASAASEERRISQLKERLENETTTGGTLREDGTLSPPGFGSIARRVQEDLELAEITLGKDQLLLEQLQARSKEIGKQIENADEQLQKSQPQDERQQRIVAVESLERELDDFLKIANQVTLPPATIQGTSIEGLIALGDQIDDTTNFCLDIKNRFTSVNLAILAAEIEISGYFGSEINLSSCDSPPTFPNGDSIVGFASSFSKFLRECRPEEVDQFLRVATRPNRTKSANAFSEEEESPWLQEYTVAYRSLRQKFEQCLADMPPIYSEDAGAALSENFTKLLLAYNPKAHLFTRAIAAFERLDAPAIFAAVIAVAIDGVILLCGIAMREPSRYGDDLSDEEIAAIERDLRLDQFAQSNHRLLSNLYAAFNNYSKDPENHTKHTKMIDGFLEDVYLIHLPNATFDSQMRKINELEELHVLHVDPTSIFMSHDQYADFEKIMANFKVE